VPRQALELPAADREIKLDFRKIDDRVTGPQIENDVGMPFDERGKKWHQAAANKGRRRTDPDASRCAAHTRVRQDGVDIRRSVQDGACRSNQPLAGLRRRNRVGRAMQQT
jgi:hypothetical protein